MTDDPGDHRTPRIESAFESMDRAAADMLDAARALQGAAKSLAKASAEGDLAKIRRALDRINATKELANAATRAALTAWPFGQEVEEQVLADQLATEVIGQGQRVGVQLNVQDGALAAFPALLRIQPDRRAVVLNGKRIHTVRPRRIAELMAATRTSRPKLSPERFVEVLYKAYRSCVGKDLGMGAPLVDIYDALTIHPDIRRDYSRWEFLRDIHLLDLSGVSRTRSGARLTLPASTGTKGSSQALTIIDSSGHPITYYSVRFYEERS